MYLWVILATFIAILGSYNLSVRPDMDRIHVENKANVFIDKFRYQHNALKDYLSSLETAQTGQSSVPYFPGDGINVSYCSSENENDHLGCYNGNEEFKKHLPLGYVLQDSPNDKHMPVSKVFCFYDEDYNNNCTSSDQTKSCCSDEYTSIFVISFQPIHSRWTNNIKNKIKPNTDFISALRKIPGYGLVIGYTTTDDNDKLVISGGQLITKSVTQTDEDGNVTTTTQEEFQQKEIFDAVKNDPDFKKRECEEKPCLFAIKQIYS